MPRKIVFNDEKQLINITSKYMLGKKIGDLTGGPRSSGNHFENIVLMYFGHKCQESQFVLYTKWKENRNGFRDNVKSIINYKNKTQVNSENIQNFTIRFTLSEWISILQYKSGISRSKLLFGALKHFKEKLTEKNINCDLRFISNYFSTSQDETKPFWSGRFKCSGCENDIKTKIKNRENPDGVFVDVSWNGKKCFAESVQRKKARITGEQREKLKYEISSKGITNFRTEALVSGN